MIYNNGLDIKERSVKKRTLIIKDISQYFKRGDPENSTRNWDCG